jgi:hypothetical protein
LISGSLGIHDASRALIWNGLRADEFSNVDRYSLFTVSLEDLISIGIINFHHEACDCHALLITGSAVLWPSWFCGARAQYLQVHERRSDTGRTSLWTCNFEPEILPLEFMLLKKRSDWVLQKRSYLLGSLVTPKCFILSHSITHVLQ